MLLNGRRELLLDAAETIGPERSGIPGMDLNLDVQQVVLTTKQYDGATLGELRRTIAPQRRHGAFLTGVTRLDHALPVRDGTPINAGDTLQFTGRAADLNRFLPGIGFRIDPAIKMDVIAIATGIIIGMLIGTIEIPLGSIPLSLGTGGGCLLAGLAFGWLRGRNPRHGQYHPAAAQVVKELGLATFICAVGLSSGPQAVDLIARYGIALPIVGVLVTLIPASISLLVAWKLLKLPAPLALGAVAGQQCSTPAATAVQQAAGNTTPLMSYTVVYAMSNVVLPLLGPIVVAMTGALT
ncbi:aspartate-alanine antiporter-like transporter [Dactylosporangium cerinum]